MKLRTVRAIARKEYLHLLRDFRSLYLAFAVPLLLILLFGYALSLDVDHIPTVVVDHDHTPQSRDLVRQLDASPYFQVDRLVTETRSLSNLLDCNQAALGIVIPPGWSADLHADRMSSLQILIDGSDPNYAGLTRSYMLAFVSQYNRRQLAGYLNRQGIEPLHVPVEGRLRVWFNEDLESRNFIVPGIIAIIIMIVGAILTSLVIAREYENGTMETLRSLPISGLELFTGKAIPYFIICLIDVLIAVLIGQLLFNVVIKASFWLLLLASGLYILVALALGLLISMKTKSQLVANQMAIIITYLPSLLLSDFVFPVTNMPPILQMLTRLVPATYFIDILNGLYLRNLGLAVLWPSYLVLAVMGGVLILLNLRAMRREGL
ncbi:MAG: ABC transporter permease [Deltaproteobacteria bacterium]|nr:ABC transporter permease [Candidatus Anaeroferrophillus wilburensis]MBN2889377.1 ABC transporter permease [Deltaproteobacteria bacterium]